MASITELGLSNEKVGGDVDLDKLPKGGSFTAMLQPGTYRFRLPANLNTLFDKVTSQKGERIKIIFDQNAPLTIIQAPEQYKARIGEPFTGSVTNVERPRGKDKIEVSDMDYLLKALGHKTRPKTNKEYAEALLQYAGKEFASKVEVSYRCRDDKNIYVEDEQGSAREVPDRKGCGAKYYQSSVDKLPDGTYPERITCAGLDGQCGASLRGFSSLAF